MLIQIFTRNFIGKSVDYEVKEENLVGGAEIYIYYLSKILKDEFNAEIEIIQTGDRTEIFQWNDIKIIKLFIPLWKQKTDQYFFVSSLFNKFVKKNALKIYNFPHYAYLGTKNPSIGIFHGVDWDIPSFKFHIINEIKFYEKGSTNLFYSILRYIYLRKFTPFFCKAGIKKLLKTISVDHEIFKYIKGFEDKIKVIHNFVDLTRFNHHIKAFQNKNENKKIIFFPQNLTISRGAYLLPEVAKELRKKREDFIFFVAGTGPLKTYLEKTVKILHLEDFVKLLGHRKHFTEMPKLYKMSDIVIIPSTYSEGTSLAVLESMAMKKTTLMTNVGGLKEIGTEKEKIIIKPNVLDITEKLNYILDNSSLRKKIGNRAYRYVKKYHTFERWKKEWIEVFQNL